MDALTDTLSESAAPYIGTATRAKPWSNHGAAMPYRSLPTTTAVRSANSMSWKATAPAPGVARYTVNVLAQPGRRPGRFLEVQDGHPEHHAAAAPEHSRMAQP